MRRIRPLLLWVTVSLLICGAVAGAQSGPEQDASLVVDGVVGPRSVRLTEAHSRAFKPITVILQNRSGRPIVVPDVASLRSLVALQVESLDAATNAQPDLVIPERNLPLTLRPKQKLAVVFMIAFGRGESASEVNEIRYAAFINRASPLLASAANTNNEAVAVRAGAAEASVLAASESTAGARLGAAPPGADMGATVTPSAMHVAIRKGQSASDPISFSAKWNKSHFVSGWSETPMDPTGDADLDSAQNSHTARVHWQNPGEYEVGVYLIHSLGNFNFETAHPTVTVSVIKVEFKDEMGNDPDGMKIGVTTGTADRSRTITATVEPASQTSNVTVKVSKGSDRLRVKNINPGSGTITFQVEGIGTEGSKAEKDCTFEADVDGKPAAKADVSVVVPKKLTQSKGAFYSKNIQANSGTTPAQPGTPGPLLATVETFYGFPVTVTVMDQFGAPIVNPNNSHLYFDAPVFESFIVKGVTYKPAPINLKISATSDYIDPVGFQVWERSFFGAPPPWGIYNPLFSPGTTPLFGIPNFPPHSKTNPPPQPTTFKVVVDGFTVEPIISRTLDIVGTTVTLTQTP